MPASAKEDEIERLWRAFRRDLSTTILLFGGFTDDRKAADRLTKNWARLCELDLDIAALIHHGVEQVSCITGRIGEPNSPSEHHLRGLQELVGMATIARDANPDAEVETLGELVALGEKEIQRQVEGDTLPGKGTRND